MRNLRIPLGAAVAALLLAAAPGGASADSDEQCEALWKTSAAAGSCTQSLDIYWWGAPVSKCRIGVFCPTDDGSLQTNDFLTPTDHAPGLINCNGWLRYASCTEG